MRRLPTTATATHRSPRAGLDLKSLPELQAQPPVWASPAPQRPEDSSHLRLHAVRSRRFGRARVAPAGLGHRSDVERSLVSTLALPQQHRSLSKPLPGSGTRGSREETGSIRAFSQRSPSVRPPGFRDLPGWMRFLIYPHGIFLLSPIPAGAQASAEHPKAALAGSSPWERRR